MTRRIIIEATGSTVLNEPWIYRGGRSVQIATCGLTENSGIAICIENVSQTGGSIGIRIVLDIGYEFKAGISSFF
jgi:hypothetical protein